MAALALILLASPGARADELDQHGRGHPWKAPTGAYTVVDFAASWCEPCRKTLPRLEAFARDHPHVRVLVVSVDEREAGRDRLVESLGLSLPVLWDESYRIAQYYEPAGMPATFVIDPNGRVVHSLTGSGRREWRELVELIERLTTDSDGAPELQQPSGRGKGPGLADDGRRPPGRQPSPPGHLPLEPAAVRRQSR